MPTVCRQRHDAMVQHGAAAEQDVTPVESASPSWRWMSVEMHTLPADPPMPRLGVRADGARAAMSMPSQAWL